MHKIKWLMLGVCFTYLAGCGSSSKSPSQPLSNQATSEQTADQMLQQDPLYYLQQAQDSYAQSADVYARNQWLMRAAEAFKQQQACAQSRKVLLLSLPELQDAAMRNQANILLAECELQNIDPDWAKISLYLDNIDARVSHAQRANKLRSLLHAKRQHWLAAAKSLVDVFDGDLQQSETIWYYLQALSEKQLQAASLSEPDLAPWLQLSLIVRQYGLQTDVLNQAVSQWQSQYPQHPLSVALPQEVKAGMLVSPLITQRIAVLLPLSGRLAQQGLAIKEGALSAYLQRYHRASLIEDSPPSVLHFFDTQGSTVADLAAQVADYDVVIGPLIKNTVSEFVAIAPKQMHVLGLNRMDIPAATIELEQQPEFNLLLEDQLLEPSDTPELAPGLRIFFALSPEDEAIQLAQKVFKTGAKYPIIITQDNGAAKRMANTFTQTWQSLSNDKPSQPEIGIFNDNESMRTSLISLLDVKQSKDRIDQIERLTSQQIHAVPRNRRDVDAIILFATPEQTELLNPIVEASLSPFNDKIVPVYASSRSFSANFSNNSLRDLRNIIFTDMPWMLPNGSQQALKAETAKIWPERDDTLKRLFALGYDAFDVLADLPALKSMPQLSIPGLTGRLSVDKSGNVVRVLPFGKITEDDVILLTQD
jgi:hypothetical protein